MAAFLRPKAQSVLASNLAEQSLSGILPPSVTPVPSHEPPPLTEPRQLSIPAAAKPGANTEGTVDTLVFPCVVMVELVEVGVPPIVTVDEGLALTVPVLPTPPPTAVPPTPIAVDFAADIDVDLAWPMPTAVDCWAQTGPVATARTAVAITILFIWEI